MSRQSAVPVDSPSRLGNVSQACQIMGGDTGGEVALRRSRDGNQFVDRIAPEVEARIVTLAIDQPAWLAGEHASLTETADWTADYRLRLPTETAD